MHVLDDLNKVNALSAIAISSLAWGLFTAGIFIHRWLSKAAGHTIPPVIPARHLP